MAIRYKTNAEQELDHLMREQERSLAAQRTLLGEKTGTLQDALNRRGRKPSDNPKQLISLRLDPEVIEFFRATGDGWQTRMNEALRKSAGLNAP